jgi:LPS sulfotransferase NodH
VATPSFEARALRRRNRPNANDDYTARREQEELPRLTYLVCTNPRSGSWLLSEGLASTHLAGNPREWFNPAGDAIRRGLARRNPSAPPTPAAYLQQALALGRTSNGVWGAKLHYYQLDYLVRLLGADDQSPRSPAHELLPGTFPSLHYIWLTRLDKARQAISYYRAAQTGKWWDLGFGASARHGGPPDGDINFQRVEKIERTFVENDTQWAAFFRACQAEPLPVTYEDLAADYVGTLRRILAWLGLESGAEVPIPRPRLRRQTDARTAMWLDKYLKYKATLATSPSTTSAATPKATDNLFDSRVAAFEDRLSPLYLEWIAEQLLRKTAPEAIIHSLVTVGVGQGTAESAVAHAASHPYMAAASRRERRLDRSLAMLDTLDTLAGLRSARSTVDRRTQLSLRGFGNAYYAANRPVVITGALGKWRALTRWTPDYLKSVLGRAYVEVMTNRESDPDYEANWQAHREVMAFSEYVDMVYGGRETNDYHMVARNRLLDREAAQPLYDDFTPLPPYLDASTVHGRAFFWFGPAGTVTPFHYDACNVLACQVAGRKRFRLVPATQWHRVVDDDEFVAAPSLSPQWPEGFGRPARPTVLDVTLVPGEILFLPVGWSRLVGACTPSITLTFTNFAFRNTFDDRYRTRVKDPSFLRVRPSIASRGRRRLRL